MTRAISKKLETRNKRGNISWHRHQPRPYGWATESLFLSASISTFWKKFNGTGRKDVNFSTHCRTTRRLWSLTYIFKKCWWKRSISEPHLLLYEEWSANENVETTPCSHRRGVGCPVPDDCPKDLQTGRFKHSGWDPLALPPGCQQNLPEVLRPFVLAQSKKSCGAILQVVSHLLDGFETESDRSKRTVTATTSPSRAIQQKNHCWLFRATT